MRTVKTIEITARNRRDIRRELINHFLDEEPGKGKGDLCSVYIYYVEDLADGNKVFLKRPAVLNKGFDFEVHVENTLFGDKRLTSMPSHKVIIEDLKKKRDENLSEFRKVEILIDDIFKCKEIPPKVYTTLSLKKGYPIETILKSIKWLFIEQDMTYWNWEGRNMLYRTLLEVYT